MSEPIKLGYRALGGTLLVILIIICGTIAIAFLIAGIALMAYISWLPYIDPSFLQTIRISFLGERILDPSYAFLLFFISGLTLAAVGIIIFGFLYYVAKTAELIDKDLSNSVENTLPSLKVLKSRKGKAVFILGIMLFGTVLTFLALIF
ncbi:MAG: hypothetical protein ACFFB2_12295 [Promethearchaeota archaeon]